MFASDLYNFLIHLLLFSKHFQLLASHIKLALLRVYEVRGVAVAPVV